MTGVGKKPWRDQSRSNSESESETDDEPKRPQPREGKKDGPVDAVSRKSRSKSISQRRQKSRSKSKETRKRPPSIPRRERSSSKLRRERSRSRYRRYRTRSRSERSRSRGRSRSRRGTSRTKRRESLTRKVDDLSVSAYKKGRVGVGSGVLNEKLFQQALDNQQNYIAKLLEDHRADVEERFEDKKKHFFTKRHIEKQFEVNLQVLSLNKKVHRLVRDKKLDNALDILEEQQDLLRQHEEDLITADSSKFGWLTVQKLRNTSCLPNSHLKKIEKIEALIERTQVPSSSFLSRNGPYRKPYKMEGEVSDQSVKTRRPFVKRSPEQLLEEAAKQNRVGTCSHCHAAGHFYRECPQFWNKVNETRKANEEKN